MPNLHRFVDAQKRDYARAKKEIAAGRKAGHWIWYILPQLRGLGVSENAKVYGIADFNEACDYLRDPFLFTNYQEMIGLVEQQLSKKPPLHLDYLMGSRGDARKLISSLTLFHGAAAFLESQGGESKRHFKSLKDRCNNIFTIINAQGYHPCPKTLASLPSGLKPQIKKEILENSNTLFSTQTHFNSGKKDRNKSNRVKPGSANLQESSPLIPHLKHYIKIRENEWSFHYNFLGIVALTYFILDKILGTDYFHIKNCEIKISAASKLMHMLDPTFTGHIEPLTNAEKAALTEGRLGATVAQYEPQALDTTASWRP